MGSLKKHGGGKNMRWHSQRDTDSYAISLSRIRVHLTGLHMEIKMLSINIFTSFLYLFCTCGEYYFDNSSLSYSFCLKLL